MKTKIINAVCKVRFLAVLLLLTFAYASAWATSCQLKVWNKATSSYVTWKTISDGYVFPSFYSCPYSGSTYALAWTPDVYSSASYPSSNNYYYQTQVYGKEVGGVAYKPTTLYLVFQIGDNYTSSPDIQLTMNPYTITYVLTGVSLSSGPYSVSATATSFDSYFRIQDGYKAPVSACVNDGFANYCLGGTNISYDASSNHLNMVGTNAQYHFEDDIIVTVTATECDNMLSTPSNLSESSITLTSVTLSWDAVSHASSYTIQIDGYSYSNTIEGVTSTSYTITNLDEGAGATYLWTVRAIGDGSTYCNSYESSTADFETPTCTQLGDAANLTVTNPHPSDATRIKFEWDAASNTKSYATKQVITISKVGGGTVSGDLDKDTEIYSMKLSSFSNGKYNWSIQAIGDGSTYCSSNDVAGNAFCIDAIGSATPSGINAAVTSNTTATISWDAVSDASYYDIEVKNNSTNAVVCSDELEETSFNATGLTTGVTYRVELQAFNACDEASVKSTSYTFEIVEYTVHWYVNGESWEGASHGNPTTAVLSGNKPSTWPTPPVVGDFCGDKFIGWTKCAISGSVGSTSSVSAGGCGLYTTQAGLPAITADTNFYAVFADENP